MFQWNSNTLKFQFIWLWPSLRRPKEKHNIFWGVGVGGHTLACQDYIITQWPVHTPGTPLCGGRWWCCSTHHGATYLCRDHQDPITLVSLTRPCRCSGWGWSSLWCSRQRGRWTWLWLHFSWWWPRSLFSQHSVSPQSVNNQKVHSKLWVMATKHLIQVFKTIYFACIGF